MGRRVNIVLLVIAIFTLWGFIPSNVPLERVERERNNQNKHKVQVLEEKGSPKKIVIGRYVYKVALKEERNKEDRKVVRTSANIVAKGRSKRKNHSIVPRLVVGLLLLVILGVVSIQFYLRGRKMIDLNSRNAFSFLELVITLAIFTIVIWAISSLLFSTRPFFTACEEKLTELNRARRLQIYLEKVLSVACEQGTDTVEIYSNKIVFPYCTVESGTRVVAGYGKIRFDGGNILVDKTGSGQEHLVAQNISSWQVIRDGDKIQMQYQFKNGSSYQFQVALLAD